MSSDDFVEATSPGHTTGLEDQEREAAYRRGQSVDRDRAPGWEIETERPRRAPTGIGASAFAALAENVRDYAIFLMDPDGIISYWGEGARLIKWWSREQAEGGHLRLLYPSGGSDDGTAEEHLRDAAARGEYTGEGQRIRSDGSTFWAGVTLTALKDEAGNLLGFAKVTRDLTARRAADALLQAAAEAADTARGEAVAASAAKSGFLATMSHEIRTPINAVIGYLDLLDLEIDGPLALKQRAHLARARESARHLLSLVSEVLDFSKIEADRVTVNRAAFRVGNAVDGALSLVSPQAKARRLEIAYAVSGYAAGLAAWGDESRVRQILANLLANAIKFTEPREGEAGRITISAGAATQPSPGARLSGEGPWVYIRVEDTGLGIAEDRLQPIFEAFVQGDMTLTRPHGGTGLGLAISRRLARLMGGDITVRSEQGVGSTFFLWLPAAPVESLMSGGVEGHGPGGEAPGVLGMRARSRQPAPETLAADSPTQTEPDAHPRRPMANGADASPSGTLHAVADALLGELEWVVHTYTTRVRTDAEMPSAHAVSEEQVEDHLASFLADLAGTLRHLEAERGFASSTPTAGVRDSTAIQRVVAERHGVQRARLGWSEPELRREFTILREELYAAVMRCAPPLIPGPSEEGRRGEAERVLELLEEFVVVAETQSLASFGRAGGGGDRPRSSSPTDPMAIQRSGIATMSEMRNRER